MFSQILFLPGWHQISIPRDPEDRSVNSIFGDDFLGPYFVYNFNQSSGYAFEDTLEVGQGYWLANWDSAMVDIEGEVNSDTVYVNLSQGWSLMGAAWWGDYPLNYLEFSNGINILDFTQAVNALWISPAIFNYNNYSGSYSLANMLKPWEGYWMFALEESLQVIYSPLMNYSVQDIDFTALENEADVSNWSLPILLQQGVIFNQTTSLGMRNDASDGYDIWFDFPAPPVPPSGDFVRAIFQRPEWNAPVGDDFCTDIRALMKSDQRYIWDFVLEASDSGQVTVIFDSLKEKLPDNYFLFAAYDDRIVDLTYQNSFILNYSTPLEIELELSDTNFIIDSTDHSTASPLEYSLGKISPNPFNSFLTIQIGLPESAELRVEVFNILGQKVTLLHNGMTSQGWHNFAFNAAGLSSGIYFVKVQVPGKMTVFRKVVFLP